MVSGSITVSGTAADDKELSKVEVSFDAGATFTAATGTTTWAIDLNTIPLSDGNLYVQAKATDSDGVIAYAFLTLIVDNVGPTVQVINPQEGQKLSGYVSIVGLGNKVDSVELKIDSGSYQTVTGNYTWYKVWDTTLETEGAHTITVRGERGGTYGTPVTVNVVVDQTIPGVTITTPAVGAYIKNTVSISGSASDNNGVDKVEISTDGGLTYTTATGTTSWSLDLNTTSIADGAKVIYARVKDVTGLMGMASIPVTVDNTNPEITLTSHTAGELVNGTVHLAGAATDSVGLNKVEIKFGPVAYQLAEGTTSWNYDFNTASLANGSYVVYAKATDFSGNYTETYVNLIVDQNFPQIATVSINNNDNLKGTVAISGTATDGDGAGDIMLVELKVGSSAYESCSINPPGSGNWSHNLDTAAFGPDGTKVITIKVTDTVGGYSTATRAVVFDNTAPLIAITNPSSGAQVAGTILLIGTASDATSGINNLNLEIDESAPAVNPAELTADITSSYKNGNWSYIWNTDSPYNFSLADHPITITASDKAGNTATASIVVEKTSTAPAVSISSHSNGDFVKGTINLAGAASASAGVQKIETKIDSGNRVLATGTTSWTQSLDTAGLADGEHTITAYVTDTSLVETFTIIHVIVDNTLPVISLSNPLNLSSIHGSVSIAGTSSDMNLNKVQVNINNTGYEDATGTTSFSKIWDTADGIKLPEIAKNNITIVAKASDQAGNENTATVTVNVVPYITALSKYSAIIGEAIIVYGYNFAPGSAITFDGVTAGTKTLSMVSIPPEYTVTIPAGASSGNVVVTTNGIPSNNVNLNIWNIDSISSSGGGTYSTQAMDSSDNIYLAFVNTSGNNRYLKFSKYTGSWSAPTTLLTYTSGSAPQYTTVAVTNTAPVHVYVVFYNPNAGQLQFCKSVDGGSSFTAAANLGANLAYPSVAAYNSTSDIISIACYNTSTLDLMLYKSVNSGTSFTNETIDATGDVGKYASIKLDSGNNPHIAYYDATNRDLKYAYWDSSASLWRKKTIDTATAGEYCSIALGTDDSVHFAYYEGNDGDLKYAYLNTPSGTPAYTIIDTPGITGWYTSIAVDGTIPRISYYDFTYGLVRYAVKNGTIWDKLTVPETETITQSYTNIKIDNTADKIQWISYSTGTTGIRVAHYLP